jgi:hypothetical protein
VFSFNKVIKTDRNKVIFYGEELLAPRPTSKLEDHPSLVGKLGGRRPLGRPRRG